MTQQAQALLNQFARDQQECPECAGESLANLRELVEELARLFPAKAFRTPGGLKRGE